MLAATVIVRIERIVLENHGDVALFRRHVVDHALADPDLARRDVLQPGNHPQQRRLAAAGRPDQHDELAVADQHVDAMDHLQGAEGLRTSRIATEAIPVPPGMGGSSAPLGQEEFPLRPPLSLSFFCGRVNHVAGGSVKAKRNRLGLASCFGGACGDGLRPYAAPRHPIDSAR